MATRDLIPWNWGRHEPDRPWRREEDSFTALQRQIDDLFNNFTRSIGSPARPGEMMGGGMVPEIDLVDEGKELVLTADLPGLSAKDIDLTLRGDTLVLSGEKKEERETKEHDVYRMERRFGRVQRRIPLPCAVKEDKIKADFKDGVLKVTLPKQEEARAGVRKITVGGE